MNTPAKKPYTRRLGATSAKRPHVANKRVPLANQLLAKNGKYYVPAKKAESTKKLEAVSAPTIHPARAAWEEYSASFKAVGIHPTWEELSDGEKGEWIKMVDAIIKVVGK